VIAHRRLFAGIALREEERHACAAVAEALRRSGLAASYEDASKLHLTLAFLGNVAESRCEQMAETLRAAVAGVAAFQVVLDKTGAFPSERRPRVVYAGARDQGVAYRSLTCGVREAYAGLGFAFDGDPVAHVTLARVKTASRALPLVDFAPIPVRIDEVRLFESLFDKAANTSRYETVARAALTLSS
jgi:2'-5' RNA ligase